jgi:hypothetical protein
MNKDPKMKRMIIIAGLIFILIAMVILLLPRGDKNVDPSDYVPEDQLVDSILIENREALFSAFGSTATSKVLLDIYRAVQDDLTNKGIYQLGVAAEETGQVYTISDVYKYSELPPVYHFSIQSISGRTYECYSRLVTERDADGERQMRTATVVKGEGFNGFYTSAEIPESIQNLQAWAETV